MSTRFVRLHLAGAIVALFAAAGQAQVITPLGKAGDELKLTPEIPGLLRVTKEKTWSVVVSVKTALFSPTKEDADANDPNSPVTSATFALPFVGRSATQTGDADSADLKVWMSGVPMAAEQSWLATPPGMQRLRGASIVAPGGAKFDFDRAAQSPGDLVYVMRPSYADRSEGLFVQLQMKFEAACRSVELDEEQANQIGWPKAWPAEAQRTFDKQMFLDEAIDPWTGIVHDIGQDSIDSIAKEILEWGRLSDPKSVQPAILAKGLAAIILPGLQPFGDGDLPVCDRFGRNVRSMDAGGNGLPPIRNAFMGVDVRDVVSVLRDRFPNQAERALVLAAIYRRVGLPARVMVGYEAAIDDHLDVQRRLAKASPEALKKGLNATKESLKKSDQEALAKQKELARYDSPMWPEVPPLKWVTVKTVFPGAGAGERHPHGGRPVPGGGRGAPGGGEAGSGSAPSRAVSPGRPAPLPGPASPKLQLTSFEHKATTRKRPRFWVEFALYDPDKGLSWVPVDPGDGGFDYHFGTLDNGENIVVLGTGFWPSQTTLVDHLGDPTRPLQCLKRDWSQGTVPQAYWTDSLPAGLWGYWTSTGQAHAHWQEIGFEASQTAASGSRP